MGRTRDLAADFDCHMAAASMFAETGQSSASGNLLPAQLAEQRLARLRRTIEGEIIPRLLVAHRVATPHPSVRKSIGRPIGPEDVQEFTRLVLQHDLAVANTYVEALRTEGASLQSVLLDLLSPAARQLGEMWEQDVCDFTEVTVGLARLQQVLRNFSPSFESEDSKPNAGLRALLVPAPGEQHTFGLLIVEEFFRREGWDVWGGLSVSQAELIDIASKQWIDAIGFSISNVTLIESFITSINELRAASRNRDVMVMVGGKLVASQPELVRAVGADLTANDGQQAVAAAMTFLKRRLKA